MLLHWLLGSVCTLTAEEVFSSISEKPIGAASLAQCHMGKLRDGRVVAVKIQHPDVKKNAFSDMSTISVSTSSALVRERGMCSYIHGSLYVETCIPTCVKPVSCIHC